MDQPNNNPKPARKNDVLYQENGNLDVLRENDAGVVFRAHAVSNLLFNFYILKRRTFKDGTCQWNICTEFARDMDKYMVLDIIRGDRAAAVARLNELLANGE